MLEFFWNSKPSHSFFFWCSFPRENKFGKESSLCDFFVFVFDSKWKADKHRVRSIHLGPMGKTLLSAGRSIKLWDLETKEVLKVR